MNWYKLSQESLENKIVWAIDEIWLTSGIISGVVLEEILNKHMILNDVSQNNETNKESLPKAAQTTLRDRGSEIKSKKPIKFPGKINIVPSKQNDSGNEEKIMSLFEKGYSTNAISKETGIPSPQIASIIKKRFETKKDSREYLESKFRDIISDVIKEKKMDINFIFSAPKISSLTGISVKMVVSTISKMGIRLHDLVLERKQKIEFMVCEFVFSEGEETFDSVRDAHERFMQKTGHKINITQSDVWTILKVKNIQLGIMNNKTMKNDIFSSFMAFLHENRNSRQTVQDILNSNKLPHLVNTFVLRYGPDFGYNQPPSQENLKEELMMKLQLTNRSHNYLSMGEGEGKFYSDYFPRNIIGKIVSLAQEGLTDEEISSQLGLDTQKVRNITQIYHLRNAPFDMEDMVRNKKPISYPKPPEPMKGYLGASVSNTKGNIKVSKEWLKKQPTLAKKWKENIPGGKAEGKTPNDFDKKEVERGKEVEYEHTPDPDTAREISMDHLEEHPDYYSGLKHMENLLKELEDKGKGKKNYDKTAGAPRYKGQLQGDEHQIPSDVMNERMRDNEVVEGEHVEKMRRMLKEKDWTNFNIYVNQLKQEGHSQNRINSMISRASVGIRL